MSRLISGRDIQDLLAFAGRGDDIVLRNDETVTPVEATSSLRPAWWTNAVTISWLSSKSTIKRIGSPWPRPPGNWLASKV
jgi:hypothetical protein